MLNMLDDTVEVTTTILPVEELLNRIAVLGYDSSVDFSINLEQIKEKVAVQAETLDEEEELELDESEHLFLLGLYLALNNTDVSV